jgi:alanyl-tRNA synthetase
MTSLKDIRSSFLGFFEENDHTVVSSGSLVPHNDPTLMFTNAGMNQFKNVFTGAETRDYVRAVSSQKCVRAGGKHNDLDNVGYTARHHTFFEMLGNFSFGDYFKEEAITYAWDFLTKELGLPKDRLSVTVHENDDEAARLWSKIAGFPDNEVIRLGDKDNFWMMGDTGPCGPNSEIFYDHGEHIPGGRPGTPEEDGDRFIEIWNLVFMQFEQIDADTRLELPKPSVDTGMGLERLASVLQGVHNNYDIDLFTNIINVSRDLTDSNDANDLTSHRVIADHLRSACFLIADGVLPSNEGRGYVLRRIMRRGMRHAHLLGAKDPLMHRLVPTLMSEMSATYPELTRANALITDTLKMEEERFRQTLERGLKLLDGEVKNLGKGEALKGEVAFKLYDTYGFPLDLTEDALRREGMEVDIDGFNTAMDAQRAAARAAWKGSGETATEEVWFDLRERTGATDFLGYEMEEAEGVITAIIVDGAEVAKAGKGIELAFTANQTPFYGESGGQVGDRGYALVGKARIEITDTKKKLGDLHIHIGTLFEGEVSVGDEVEFHVDHEKRTATRANHSATHLLHAALRRVLGDHVTQKGSQVDDEKLRFDFSHQKAISPEEMLKIETEVNAMVLRNESVSTKLMTPEAAVEEGAMALFGEKYGDEVRVLSMGTDEGANYSVELCGGTHVDRLGDIGLIKVTGESAVASGVRRIEGLTGKGAKAYLDDQAALLADAAAVLKSPARDLPARITALVAERKKLDRELTEAKKALALSGGAGASDGPKIEEIAGVKFLGQALEGVSGKDLPGLIDDAKAQVGSGVVAFACNSDGKAAVAIGVTDDMTGTINAADLVKVAVEAVGGKGGGGRPDMARGGGPNGADVAKAIEAVKAAIAG